MIGRRALLGLGLAALASPLVSRAQKVYRIGLLLPGEGRATNIEGFYRALRELGYVEGRNIVLEKRHADGHDERYSALAAELVNLPVDVLLAAGPSATLAARDATKTIPIVMGTIDPVEQGLIASLARPGGNITGWAMLSIENAEKELALLKEAMPKAARVAVLANPQMAGRAHLVDTLRDGAKKMDMRLSSVEVASSQALAPAFATMARERVDAIVVVPDPVVMDPAKAEVTRLAAQHRLPAIYQWRMFVDAGGLMSYGPSLAQLTASWATYVDKILKGAKPGDLPVETPRKFELILNAKAAAALGFTFPSALMLAADEIIR